MICPIMSKPIATVEPNDNSRIEVEWIDCKENKCAWWTGLHVRDGDRMLSLEYKCAIVQIAMKSVDGTISA